MAYPRWLYYTEKITAATCVVGLFGMIGSGMVIGVRLWTCLDHLQCIGGAVRIFGLAAGVVFLSIAAGFTADAFEQG